MKTVTNLTSESVSILTVTDGQNHRRAYSNSESGRTSLAANEPQEVVDEVMAVWGDSPTVEETEYEPPESSESGETESDVESDVWDGIAEAIRSGVNEV